ncbi:MAG: type II toxin-antitoxin system VapC family toxin [Chloroflexi bacterium]|nr:type II toxin-antitoxin system VapC family toxin [Chloroflexota bacterium]
MPARVVDASVLAAWCFREPRASEALGLLQGPDLYAPYLLAYELASIARRKATAYPERLEVLSEALATALALPIHWSDVDHVAVLRLALDANLATYDASYLYLARALGAPLATFDQRLVRAAQDAGA